MIRTILKKIIPRTVIDYLRSLQTSYSWRKEISENFAYDKERYIKNSIFSLSLTDETQLTSMITATCHSIEKGMAVENTKPGFSLNAASSLCSLLNEYHNRNYSKDCSLIQSAHLMLERYINCNKHTKTSIALDEDIAGNIEIENGIDGGSFETTKSEILKGSKGDFESLVNSRHSIRHFSNEPVDVETLKKAIALAQQTPSSCNRQCARVYIIQNREKFSQVTKLLTGYKGFTTEFNKLLFVASDLRVFSGSRERNQAYLEGGMFAMTLLYALHFYGLGACALNWAVLHEKDKKIRKLLNLADSHIIVLFIAVGNIADELKIACSQRLLIDKIHYIK